MEQKEQANKNPGGKSGRTVRIVLIICAILLVAGLAGYLIWREGGGADGIIALSYDESGQYIRPDTHFLLPMGEELENPQSLRDRLELDPDLAYDLVWQEAEGDLPSGYRLVPLRYLEAGTVLKAQLDGRGYSFDVQALLLVTSTSPADGGERVPLYSGIEFALNTRDLSLDSFREAFSIQPPTPGEFGYGDNRYYFYPTDSYLENERYTVTLAAGMSTLSGSVLEEDYTLTFVTVSQEEQDSYWSFQLSKNEVSYNALLSEAPLLQFYMDTGITGEHGGDAEVEVTLHAFPSWEDYRDSLRANATRVRYSYTPLRIDTDELEEFSRFTLQALPAQQSDDSYLSYQRLLEFPEALPEGWYAATFKVRNLEGRELVRQLYLQSSDLSLFHMQAGDDLLVWVNDGATGQPVEGARYTMTGSFQASGTTDGDGQLLVKGRFTDEPYSNEPGAVFTVTDGDRVFVDADDLQNYGEGELRQDYLHYLFTDRPIYHTTDTIHVWGMARPRIPEPRPLEDLKLVFEYGSLEQAVELAPDGTFTAELALENTVSGWVSLTLMTGEQQIHTQYLRVEDFVKPVYTATTRTDRPVYLLTEDTSADITLEVTTYDGTPVSDFVVSVSSWGDLSLPEGQLLTDAQGLVRLQAPITQEQNTWYPQSYYYQFRSDDAVAEPFYRSGHVYAVHRDVMLTARPEILPGGTRVEVGTHRIDLSGIDEPGQLWERKNLQGASLSQAVTAQLYKVYYTREVYGTYYDFIHRERRESYTYVRHEDLVDTYLFSTQDGTYLLENLPAPEEDAYYYLQLSTPDSTGREVAARTYLGCIYERDWYGSTASPRYVLNKVPEIGTEQPVEDTDGGFRYSPWSDQQARYVDGENVTFRLENNDEAVTDFTGRILWGVFQEGLVYSAQSSVPTVTLPYSDELIPNYVVTGAYFDGRHVFLLENKYMYYNSERRELEIRLEPDRDSYRPGDQAQVSAAVTNKYTGQPAGDTTVVLSVVDEAVFALREQDSDILSDVYGSVFYPSINKYASYTPSDLNTAGEKGGGGGEDDTRTDFEDTAHFSTAVTDASGRASFSFQLPDNITSWRLTSLALSPASHAGNAVENIAVTKEFFLLPVLSEQILAGDTFAVGLRGSGAQVSASDEVAYQVILEGDGVRETRLAASPLRTYASVSFDTLEPGDYTVTVRGECGSYADAVQLPLSVVTSGVEVSLVKTVDLREGLSVESLRYPVSVQFYDKGWRTYSRVLRNVWENSHGGRADMRLARKYVSGQFDAWGSWYGSDEESVADVAGAESLISLFPYTTADLELTVKARLALPGLVSGATLAGRSVADDWYDGARTAVYLAQALSGEDLAADPVRLLEQGENLDYVDSIYLAAALALSGQEAAAAEWYEKLVTPHLQEITGLSGQVIRSVDPKDPVRSMEDCTAAASLLATLLDRPEAESLVLYLVEKPSRYEPYLLEQLFYLTRFQPAEGGGAQFRYTINGEETEISLDREPHFLALSREQLSAADFQVLSGEVYADLYYTGAPDQADTSTRILGLTKTIEAVDGGELQVGSVVKVTLTPDFSGLDTQVGDTLLVIDDYIPSGMRFERYDLNDFYTESYGWSLDSRQGQRLQFSVYGVTRTTSVRPIVYYARCTTPGDYVVESAYISSARADSWGATPRERVSIG